MSRFGPFFLSAFCWAIAAQAWASEAVFPLLLNGEGMGDVRAEVSSTGSEDVWIEESGASEQLAQRLEPEAWKRVSDQAVLRDGKWKVSLKAFRNAGLGAKFSTEKLEIQIEAPLAFQKKKTLSLNHSRAPEAPGKFVQNSPVTAFLNLQGSDHMVVTSSDPTRREPFSGALDGALQVHKWVGEGSATYAEPSVTSSGGSSPWRRGDLRVVRDWPEKTLRFSGGDLQYPSRGFARFRPMAGVSAVSVFSLRPYDTFVPLGRTDIQLKSPSTVRVKINGQLLQTLNLPAGRYDLRDFPFSAGVNLVTLEITDATGRTEVLQVPTLGSDKLLVEGTHEVNSELGIPSQDDLSGRKYFGDRPTASVQHRYGLSDRVTLGGFAQGDRTQEIGGPSLTVATFFGNFSLDGGVSHTHAGEWATSQDETGFGGLLGYTLADHDSKGGAQRSASLSLETRGPRFRELNEDGSFVATSHTLSAGVGLQLTDRTGLNLSQSIKWIPSASPQTQSLASSVGLSQNWKPGLDTSLFYSRTQTPANLNHSVFFLLTWVLPDPKHVISALYQSDTEYARTQWAYQSRPLNEVGGFASTVGLERNAQSKGADVRADYSGNRFKLGGDHTSRLASDSQSAGVGTHRTGLSFGTALVFSGSKIALSRPVEDGFVLVSPEKDLSGAVVRLNGRSTSEIGNGDLGQESYAASTDNLGSGVVPDLVSYRVTEIRFEKKEMPNVKAWESTPYNDYAFVRPTYKSGAEVLIGRSPQVSAKGRLLDQKGKVLSLWSGELVDSVSKVVQVVFTNREGEFFVEGLTAGERYRIRPLEPVWGVPLSDFEFRIPENAQRFFAVGGIKLK